MNSSASKTRKKSKGRTFQCSGYPDCNMTFTRSEHLARHIRKHTGERPFECVHCSRKFSRLDNLRQHKQTVHAHEQLVMDNDKTDQESAPTSTANTPTSSSFNHHYNHHHHHHQQQQQQYQPQQENKLHRSQSFHTDERPEVIIQQQDSSNLPAAHTLLRPTQFRSKHRPRPLALPSRKSVYTDAPYTVPTPRSSNSNHFILSPISPHQLNPNTTALPSVQFLTSNPQQNDGLISPYNSSFGSSHYGHSHNHSISSHSNSNSTQNTPTTFQFDLKTPTNSSFQDFKSPYQSNNNNSNNNSNGINRRSWLNNVLNSNFDSNQLSSSQTSTQSTIFSNNSNYSPSNSSINSNQSPNTNNLSDHSEKKLRIENLLNTHNNIKSDVHINHGNNTNTNNNNNNNSNGLKLPHVGHLGVDLSTKN